MFVFLVVGILSLVQMSRIHLFGNYYLGTGLISVVGTSFATLSTANAVCIWCSCLDRLGGLMLDPAWSEDIQLYVCRWHMPIDNSGRWDSDTRALPGRVRNGARCDIDTMCGRKTSWLTRQ